MKQTAMEDPLVASMLLKENNLENHYEIFHWEKKIRMGKIIFPLPILKPLSKTETELEISNNYGWNFRPIIEIQGKLYAFLDGYKIQMNEGNSETEFWVSFYYSNNNWRLPQSSETFYIFQKKDRLNYFQLIPAGNEVKIEEEY